MWKGARGVVGEPGFDVGMREVADGVRRDLCSLSDVPSGFGGLERTVCPQSPPWITAVFSCES